MVKYHLDGSLDVYLQAIFPYSALRLLLSNHDNDRRPEWLSVGMGLYETLTSSL